MRPEDFPPICDSGGFRDRFPAACRVLEEAIAARAFPGCAFGVLAGGSVALEGALGRFTYEDDSPLVQPKTVFDVASVTKVAATTAAAMLLAQRGRFNVDSLLGDWLPEFLEGRAASDPARKVTLRHLLAHNSGLPAYERLFLNAATPNELLRACLRLQLEAEPGDRAEYSDPGFILLGKALEAAMGQPLDAWVHREIFAPLGMSATAFRPAGELRSLIPPTLIPPTLIPPTLIPPASIDATFRHRRIQGEVQDENAWVLGGVSGHAGLFSNVSDLLRFSAEIIKADAENALFRPETIAMFAARQAPKGSSRALGWDTPSENSSSGKYFSRHSIGHLGYSGCSLWIDLDAEIAIVLLTNRTWPDRKSQLIREVRPAFHDAVRKAL